MWSRGDFQRRIDGRRKARKKRYIALQIDHIVTTLERVWALLEPGDTMNSDKNGRPWRVVKQTDNRGRVFYRVQQGDGFVDMRQSWVLGSLQRFGTRLDAEMEMGRLMAAVDPQVTSTGNPTTRDKGGFFSPRDAGKETP